MSSMAVAISLMWWLRLTMMPMSPCRSTPSWASFRNWCRSWASSDEVGLTFMSFGSNEQNTMVSARARVTATLRRRCPPGRVTGPKFIGTLFVPAPRSPGPSLEKAMDSITVSASSP